MVVAGGTIFARKKERGILNGTEIGDKITEIGDRITEIGVKIIFMMESCLL